jgi:probable rRNA maturation factor
MSIEINNESGLPVDEVALVELGRYVLDSLSVNPMAELSIVLLDVEAMAALHRQWMDVEGPTDVMAFPMDAEDLSSEHAESSGPPRPDANGVGALLGDVVLCPEVAAEQARHAGHSTEAELQLLCTHGILHLLGYDHGEPDEEREMFGLQARLVGDWAERSGRGPIRAPRAGTRGELRDTATGAHTGERRG